MLLYFWASSQQKAYIAKKGPIVTATADVTATIKKDDAPSLPPAPVEIKKLNEKTSLLENDKLSLEFSNIGGALNRVTIKEYNASLPVLDIASLAVTEILEFTIESLSPDTIVYVYEDNDKKITKKYQLKKDDYIVQSENNIQFKNKMSTLDELFNAYTINTSNLSDAKISATAKQDHGLFEYAVSYDNKYERKNNAFKFDSKEQKSVDGKINWVGFRDRYYCVLVKPNFDTKGFTVLPRDTNKLSLQIKPNIVTDSTTKSLSLSTTIFYGPEITGLLKQYNLGFEEIKLYYKKVALFDIAAKFIHFMMNLFYKLVHNWGVSIILISIFVYLLTYPLTMRAMLSAKKMQEIQPKMTVLREKHKSNPQRLNKEMMELYKEYKINPLGGCLPMVLQLPVFIGLYQVLWRSVQFKGAKFLWMQDLSLPDRFLKFPITLPLLGDYLNLLPLIMIVVMFFQQKLSTKNMAGLDPNQVAQQKMMAIFFPIFLGWIFYNFASGLTLYFTCFYVFSMITQLKISKYTKA